MKSCSEKLVPELIPGWVERVLEDVSPTEFDLEKIRFVSFLQGKEGIDGIQMRRRAKKLKGNLGLSDVPRLLGFDGKGLKTIPMEIRGGNYHILIPGTLLLSKRGYTYIPALYWDGECWKLDFASIMEFMWKNKRELIPVCE